MSSSNRPAGSKERSQGVKFYAQWGALQSFQNAAYHGQTETTGSRIPPGRARLRGLKGKSTPDASNTNVCPTSILNFRKHTSERGDYSSYQTTTRTQDIERKDACKQSVEVGGAAISTKEREPKQGPCSL